MLVLFSFIRHIFLLALKLIDLLGTLQSAAALSSQFLA